MTFKGPPALGQEREVVFTMDLGGCSSNSHKVELGVVTCTDWLTFIAPTDLK
jgi:hypothetical protein